jgi:predicted NACHT family NTPase
MHEPIVQRPSHLLQGIRHLEEERRGRLGEDIPPLIDSPLLVRMLLIVHLSNQRMPEHRAELYLRATESLLWPDYLLDTAVGEQIGKLVGGKRETHRELAQYLAFSLHRRGERQGRAIDEDDLVKLLNERDDFRPLVKDFLALTRTRGTLLEERDRTYQFIPSVRFSLENRQNFRATRIFIQRGCSI